MVTVTVAWLRKRVVILQRCALLLTFCLVALCTGKLAHALPNEGSAMPDDVQAMSLEAANSLLTQHTATQTYTVCLKPNSFYTDLCQPSDRQYLSSLTDTINLDFKYKLASDARLDYSYLYKITGKLVVYDKDDKVKEIFSKYYDLAELKTGRQKATTTLDLAETITLDYPYFNAYAQQFKAANALSGEAILIVEMKLDLTATHNGSQISRPVNLDFTIPLTKQTYSIKIGAQPNKDDLLEFVAAYTPFWRSPIFIMSILAVTIVAILLGWAWHRRRRLGATKSPAERYNAKIHREYGRIIVDLKTPLRAQDYQHHYTVKEFADLIDKADRVMQNVLCFTSPGGRIFYAVIEGENIFLHGCPYKEKKISGERTAV